jgi:hypothetical protein
MSSAMCAFSCKGYANWKLFWQVGRSSASAVAFGIGSFAGRGTLGPGKQRAFAVVSDSKGNDIHLRFHDTCVAYKVLYLPLSFGLCSILFPNSLPDPGNGCNPMSTIYGLLWVTLQLSYSLDFSLGRGSVAKRTKPNKCWCTCTHIKSLATCRAWQTYGFGVLQQSKKYRMPAVEKLQAEVYELVAKAVKERLGLAVTAEDVSSLWLLCKNVRFTSSLRRC